MPETDEVEVMLGGGLDEALKELVTPYFARQAESPKKTVARLTLPYPPSANDNWRYRVNCGPELAPEVKTFRDAVGFECLRQRPPKAQPGAEITFAVTLYRPLKSGDLDNRLKTLIDSLRGHVYPDDSQIVRIVADREDDPENPRAEVVISWLALPLPDTARQAQRGREGRVTAAEARRLMAEEKRLRGRRK